MENCRLYLQYIRYHAPEYRIFCLSGYLLLYCSGEPDHRCCILCYCLFCRTFTAYPQDSFSTMRGSLPFSWCAWSWSSAQEVIFVIPARNRQRTYLASSLVRRSLSKAFHLNTASPLLQRKYICPLWRLQPICWMLQHGSICASFGY